MLVPFLVAQAPALFPGAQAPAPAPPSTTIVAPQKLPSVVRWSVAMSARPAAPPVFSGSQLSGSQRSGPHVYVALQSGGVDAYRVDDGAVVWHRDLRADQPMAVDGDRLIVVSAGTIEALQTADGSPVWSTPAAGVTAPLLAQDGWIIVASRGQLTAYRAADGSQVWRQESGPQHLRAAIEGDRLYVPLDDGWVRSLDLRTGTERWKSQLDGEPTEVLAFADHVYVGSANKSFYCINAGTGEKSWRFPVGAAVRGRPAADALHVYVTAVDNQLRAFDPRNGALRWHVDVKFRPSTGPVVVGSSVIVPGTSAQLRAWRARDGRAAGQIAFDEPLAVPPAFAVSSGESLMAAVTGSLSGHWTLSLMFPEIAYPIVAPLTGLPGLVVPIRPRGR